MMTTAATVGLKAWRIICTGLSRVTSPSIVFSLVNLLGTSSKIEKGSGAGWASNILYLSPFTRARKHARSVEGKIIIRAMSKFLGIKQQSIREKIGQWNSCAFALANGCVQSCLAVTSGHLKFPELQRFEFIKTLLLMCNREIFEARLSFELCKLQKKAHRAKLQYAARLNGGSDLNWVSFIAQHSTIQFWDYTKDPTMMMRYLSGLLPSNYHLTFSRGSSNWSECVQILKRGGNVAVVRKVSCESKVGTTIRIYDADGSYIMVPVISGDETDYRFNDVVNGKRGAIVELFGKGSPINSDTSGFALDSYDQLGTDSARMVYKMVTTKGCASQDLLTSGRIQA